MENIVLIPGRFQLSFLQVELTQSLPYEVIATVQVVDLQDGANPQVVDCDSWRGNENNEVVLGDARTALLIVAYARLGQSIIFKVIRPGNPIGQ